MFCSRLANKINFSGKRAISTSLREKVSVNAEAVHNNIESYQNGEVNVSKLSNGVTVISKNGNGVNTSFGLYVKAGSAYENPSTAGAGSVLRRHALKSTYNTSGLRVARFIQSTTGTFDVQHGRETIEYHTDFLRPNADSISTALTEILYPRLAEWEVRDSHAELLKEFKEPRCPFTRVIDAIYFQAFKGQGVGRPLTSKNNLANLDQTVLESFAANVLRRSNGVSLVGVGIDHSSLLSAAESFAVIPNKPVADISSTYFGGEHFEEDLSSHATSFAVAFPVAKQNVLALRVAAHLLGAGKITASTPIGEGVTSRLYSLVQSNSKISFAKSFVLDGSNGGGNFPFFGVAVRGAFGNTIALQSAVVSELSKLADSLTEQEVSRAIKLAKLHFASQLEDKSSLKNILYHLQANPVDHLAQFDALTLADVRSAITSTFSAAPTVVCIGDLTGLSSVKL